MYIIYQTFSRKHILKLDMFIENGMRVCYFCIFWKELFPSHSWKYLCVFQLKVSYIPRYKDIPFKKYIDIKYRNEEQNSLGKKKIKSVYDLFSMRVFIIWSMFANHRFIKKAYIIRQYVWIISAPWLADDRKISDLLGVPGIADLTESRRLPLRAALLTVINIIMSAPLPPF